MSTRHPSKNSYVAAIDGLRAVAVLSVVIFHVDEALIPGGFTGVDIFFVISGYVITKSLHEKFTPSFKGYIADFYRRRFLRLAPALIVCLLVTALVSSALIPESWLSQSNDATGLAAFFGVSNFVLINTADGYFGETVPFNPFVHTWSLAVEEQFYVVFPILLFCILSYSQANRSTQTKSTEISRSLLFLALASLLFSAFESQYRPSHAFYLLPSRFWELAIGALTFQVQNSGTGLLRRRHSTTLLTWAGFALLTVGLLFSDGNGFPVPWAILSVIGTAFLILAFDANETQSSIIAKFLTLRPVIFIGLISYSLYLWHWPILVMFRWTTGIEETAWLAVCLAAIFLTSIASYYFVEQPWRNSALIASLSHATVIFMNLAVILAASLTALWIFRSPSVFNQSVTMDRAIWGNYISIDELDRTVPPSEHQVDKKLFVVGDSHAWAYGTMLKMLSHRFNIEVISIRKPGCSFLDLIKPASDSEFCADHVGDIFSQLKHRAVPGDIVFLASLRAHRLSSQTRSLTEAEIIDSRDSALAQSNRRAALQEAYEHIKKLSDLGLSILIDKPKPVFRSPPLRCADWFNRGNPVCAMGFEVPKSFLYWHNQPIQQSLSQLETAFPHIWFWDPFPILCPGDVCSTFEDSVPVFIDGDHLSGHGNRILYPFFEAKVLEILAARPIGAGAN